MPSSSLESKPLPPEPTRAEINDAIKLEYSETLKLCTGYLVINKNHEIVLWSLGASRLFGSTEAQMMEELNGERILSIADFFPPQMTKERHATLIEREFDLMNQALQTEEAYVGRHMAAKDGKVKFVPGKTIDGEEISFGIEFCPLFVSKRLYIVGFVTRNPEDFHKQRAIAATSEASQVMQNAKLQLASDVANVAGSKFLGVYDFFYNRVFHKSPEVYRGPLSYLFSAATVVSLLGFFGTLAFHIWGPKPEFRNYNFDRPEPVSPSSVQTGSPNRNPVPGE